MNPPQRALSRELKSKWQQQTGRSNHHHRPHLQQKHASGSGSRKPIWSDRPLPALAHIQDQDKNPAAAPSIAWVEIFASCRNGLHSQAPLAYTQTYHLHFSHPVEAKKSPLETVADNFELLRSRPTRQMPLPLDDAENRRYTVVVRFRIRTNPHRRSLSSGSSGTASIAVLGIVQVSYRDVECRHPG